ncbi:MAG TPA: TIGR03986 family CRISPR-associated RAMP protein [Blastocatellia bacterium]|nr:TIGR03986 family CRISPR-associated RAMP protein [Blastocatellia bacterium]HMX29278.1 TIGR03986 family CRISPR-associated RAMP protein [Blastocatellia bacterium]HNG28324.1 TIGR03986 family CRISPR-associated RAMP protein [Blastocatellia bacterium]
MTILNLPKHIKPEDLKEDRRSTAAYNFIPLPEKVVVAVNDPKELPSHDTYADPKYENTGYFDVTLKTKSPLYVRGMLTRDEFDLDEQGRDRHGLDAKGKDRDGNQVRQGATPFADRLKNRPDFFHTGDATKPVIPGSSLRGMLRSLVEIVSYGKVSRVSDKKLFFRTMDDSAVGDHYRGRMSDRVETGFLFRQGRQYSIKKCSMARVFRDDIKTDMYEAIGSDKIPRWKSSLNNQVQYRPVWILLNEKGDRVSELSTEKVEGWTEGRQVITGNIPKKKKEFVFLLPAADTEEVAVPEAIVQRFHDDDQLTAWQEKAFPANRPLSGYRERDGWLGKNPDEYGEPIFFLRENDQLTFVGRARMFRLPYVQRPLDLVDESLRDVRMIDFADAVFGYVEKKRDETEQGNKANAYASRVQVTEATTDDAEVFLPGTPFATEILATPKPTAFQHYLIQTSDIKRKLRHFDSSRNDTAIRGNKLYWKRGSRTLDELRAKPNSPNVDANGHVTPTSTQHTLIKPVRSDVQFKFRVYFENLSNEELGALCWALHPLGDKQKYCHQLGMGKPLGMGAVELDATLHLNNRKERYGSLFGERGWITGYDESGLKLAERSDEIKTFTDAFEAKILGELRPFKDGRECSRLAELKRIAMLLKMMEWENGLSADDVQTQGLQTGFKDRRVLPDPSHWIPKPERDKLVEPMPPQNPAGSAARSDSGSGAKSSGSAKNTPSGMGNTLNIQTETAAAATPKAQSGKERVTLISKIKAGGKAQVKIGNEQITCEKMPTTPFNAPQPGDLIWANITRDKDGKAISAKYLLEG